MFDNDDPSADEIVQAIEDLHTEVNDLEDSVPDEIPDPDEFEPETPDVPGQDDIREQAGQTFFEQMEHLLHEDCDTEACNQIREELGIDPGEHDHEGDDGSSDSDSGSDDESGSDGGDNDDESPHEWDEGENIFGESV